MDKTTLLVTAAMTGFMLAACKPTEQVGEQSNEPVYGECYGINSCKGKGACGTEKHSCAGQNSCKGQGWVKETKGDCETKKGSWKELSMEM